jgi:RNA polymerase sigma factor (sigma-70 family)
VGPIGERGRRLGRTPNARAARKRAAIETYARHETALRRTARRYSLCEDDADEALQRGLEILLRKAPTDDPRELIRWTQTVVKHEALAVRRERERILAAPPPGAEHGAEDWLALIPSEADGPPERAERSEAVARSREALRTLKPQELRALGLLAEGYSYAEIGEITGFSKTKINRCLAEGRERFRRVLAGSEDGTRCAEMGPLLSAFCDGEAGAEEAALLREHLRACSRCRSTLRAYRAAPAAVAALAPALPVGRSLPGRIHDALGDLASRLGGGGADSAVSQVAGSGGARGMGVAALAKAAAICAGTIGGAAACAATGVVPAPFGLDHSQQAAPKLERRLDRPKLHEISLPSVPEQVPEATPDPASEPSPKATAEPPPPPPPAEPESSGSVEYAPPPAPAPVPASSAPAGGNPAGEFGP